MLKIQFFEEDNKFIFNKIFDNDYQIYIQILNKK